jgi:hypothetical protein
MGDTYGHDDLIDLCHARPLARRGRLVVLSLACMEDSASTATDPGSHKAQALSNVRAQSPVRRLNSGGVQVVVQMSCRGIAIGLDTQPSRILRMRKGFLQGSNLLSSPLGIGVQSGMQRLQA